MLSKEQLEQGIVDLDAELEIERSKNRQLQRSVQGHQSMFSGDNNDHLSKWLLDLEKEKKQMEHIYRGHVPKMNDKEEIYYEPHDDPIVRLNMKVLSEYGVYRVMNWVNNYLNRNIIMGNYNEKEINEKVHAICDEIADDILLDFENFFYKPSVSEVMIAYGLDPNIKHPIETWKRFENEAENIYTMHKDRYFAIVRQLKDNIHGAYKRALNGEEKKMLRTMIHVSQTDALQRPQQLPQPKKGILGGLLKWS